MRLQLWILTQSQILDMVFAEYPWDIASSTSRKRLLDFLDRVARQKDSKLLSHSELLPILTKALAWKLSSQLESIKPAVRWLISIRSSSQGRTGAGVTQTLGHFMSRKARERHFQRVLALLSVDVTTITGTYLGQMLVWPFLRRSFSEVRAPWILRALNNWPGVRIMREVHALDGTLIYLDPQEYLRKTPALLKDALLIMPASFTAAALVGGAFISGRDVGQLWSNLITKDGKVDNTPLRKIQGVFLQALGLPVSSYDPENGIRPHPNLGAIDMARWLQRLLALTFVIEDGKSTWGRLRAGVTE